MQAFRAYLGLMIVALGTFTVFVGVEHGWNLMPVFFGDIAAMTWPGQFNSDFLCFLSLSGLWLAWRHDFTAGGLALGVLGVFGGMMLLAPYLLWATSRADGDIRVVMLGERRAAG